jgi:iron complex transport system ATP-binding protein
MGLAVAPLVAEGVGYRVAGRDLVRAVDLEARAGEVLALVGPNGAGKSTLLGLLAGDLRPSAGRVLLDGVPIRRVPARRRARARAVLPQTTLLRFGFTAREVVAMGRHPHRRALRGDDEEDGRVVAEELARVDAAHLAGRAFPTLSGGEAARVSLARVLAQRTPILLLDEPTAALDIRHQSLLMRVLAERAASGATCVVIVHDLNLAARHADRIALLAGGALTAVGEPWEVLTERQIAEAFGGEVTVVRHPGCDRPLVVAGG